jgi:helix-turn-helix protein
MTQTDEILELLRERGSRGLTPLDALDSAGCYRLAARVADLKKRGHDIETRTYKTAGGARVALYVLRDPQPAGTFVQTSWTDA